MMAILAVLDAENPTADRGILPLVSDCRFHSCDLVVLIFCRHVLAEESSVATMPLDLERRLSRRSNSPTLWAIKSVISGAISDVLAAIESS